MEEDGVEEAPPAPRSAIPMLIASAVLMELLFVFLLADRQIVGAFGLRSTGPFEEISGQMSTLLSAAILGVGFVAGFFLYSHMGSRVGGVIAIPLAAVEALASPAVVPFLLLGVGISYVIGAVFFQKLLIYGRRLFYVYLTVSVLVMVQLLVQYKLDPLSFSFIIPRIIAYNLHVDRDKKRSVVIAVLYFAGLAILGVALVSVGRL